MLENERLDSLWRSLSSRLHNADGSLNLKVVDRMTRLSERRSRMNGIEAAQEGTTSTSATRSKPSGSNRSTSTAAVRPWLEAGQDEDIMDAEVIGG